jgi:Holliday junction resolvasome RuvABC DNA-binding subunit
MSHALTDVPGVGPSTAEILNANNIDSVNKLAEIDIRELTLVPGIGEITGRKMIQAARNLVAADKTEKAGKTNKKEQKVNPAQFPGSRGTSESRGALGGL